MRKLLTYSAFFVITPVIFLFALIFTLILYTHKTADSYLTYDKKVVYAALPSTQNVLSGTITEKDGRAEKLRQFLDKYNSPLEPYADDLVNAADEYGIDHRLLTAIAMQESGLCKTIPIGSHNCWGFGIYGGTVTRFSDYKEAIYTVSKTLATKYKTKGLVTPEQIMTMYTPSSNGSWAFSVNYFMSTLQ
jgi:hypothetical protein